MTNQLVFNIGGQLLALEGESLRQFAISYDGIRPFFSSEGTPLWTVRSDVSIEPFHDGSLLNKFDFAEIGSHCFFYRKEHLYQFTMLDDNDGQPLVTAQYQRGDDKVLLSSCNNFSAIRFALWFAYSMLTAGSKLTFVHSSVIVYRERAVLFLGESGTGKSTHTRLWLNNIEGTHLLNDDSPMLAVVDGVPYVYGSPWSGKTPCYHNRHFPLAAVVRLSQAPHNAMRRLSVFEALGALQPSLPPALMQDEWFADLLIDIISDSIASAPFYHLECLPDAAAARLSCGTVYGT